MLIMQQWEYHVIHLNVDSSAPGKDDAASPPPADAHSSSPPFTKTYLEQEFPAHYGRQQPIGSSGAAPAQQPQHPATQLQAFINNHGRQGWELLGIFPLGSLLMMIFRRPLPSSAEAATPGSVRDPSASGDRQADAALRTILERLAVLEERLAHSHPGGSAPGEIPQWHRPAAPSPSGARQHRSQAPWILARDDLQALRDGPACSSAVAARSLGFRSTASLLNPASRHGYPIGLVRIGPNGKAAVYQGLAPNQRGGKELRLWLVLERDRLPDAPAATSPGEC
jgi:hypothetical protein